MAVTSSSPYLTQMEIISHGIIRPVLSVSSSIMPDVDEVSEMENALVTDDSPGFFNKQINVRLDDANFLLWRQQVLLMVRGQGLEHFLDGDVTPPVKMLTSASGVRSPNPTYQRFVKQDSSLASWLLSTVSTTILPHLVGAETSASIWKAIGESKKLPDYKFLKDGRVFISRNVVFNENVFPFANLQNSKTSFSSKFTSLPLNVVPEGNLPSTVEEVADIEPDHEIFSPGTDLHDNVDEAPSFSDFQSGAVCEGSIPVDTTGSHGLNTEPDHFGDEFIAHNDSSPTMDSVVPAELVSTGATQTESEPIGATQAPLLEVSQHLSVESEDLSTNSVLPTDEVANSSVQAVSVLFCQNLIEGFEISQDLQPLSPLASRNSIQVKALAGMIECSVCHSKIAPPGSKTVSRAYDTHRSYVSSKTRLLNVLLVAGDCILVGFQPILVYMSKVDGGFKFSPISVNFLTELAKVAFAIIMLLIQVLLAFY
ncbi:hypothetical protein GQ457_08G020290 [Hibiscus cannabinus]